MRISDSTLAKADAITEKLTRSDSHAPSAELEKQIANMKRQRDGLKQKISSMQRDVAEFDKDIKDSEEELRHAKYAEAQRAKKP